jgi:hypothetical protein
MYEKILEPGDMLYHGTKKKIDFCELGGTCETEPYGFTTDNFEYAKMYAGNKGKVLAWTPIRKVRILILSRESLKDAIDWIKDTYKENFIDLKVAKRIVSKDMANRSLKNTNPDIQFKKAMQKYGKLNVFERVKKMKPYEFFSVGERFDKNKAKELRKKPVSYDIHTFLPGGLRALEFECVHYKLDKHINIARMEKEEVGCGPISLTKNGYFRYSEMGFDVGMYHYLFKYLKHMKYDGVKLITNGFGDDINAKVDTYPENKLNKVEFVIGSKLLKKVDTPDAMENPKKECPEGKILNPKTKRCIKDRTKTKDEKDDKVTKTKDEKDDKVKKQVKKECPEGKILNPKTNRCIKDQTKTKDKKDDKVKKQVKKECPEGKILNPKTNRCIKDNKN